MTYSLEVTNALALLRHAVVNDAEMVFAIERAIELAQMGAAHITSLAPLVHLAQAGLTPSARQHLESHGIDLDPYGDPS